MRLNLSKFQTFRPEIITEYPKGFKVVIDTREQAPFFSNYPVEKVVKTLHIGDYSIEGFEDMFAVERKQTSDFFSYVGKEYGDKTSRKLRRLSECEVGILVVEGNNYHDLLSPQVYTKVQSGVVEKFFDRVMVKYGVHFFCDRDRRVVERWLMQKMVYYYMVKTGIKF